MKKATTLVILAQAALLAGLHAQGRGGVPLMRPEEAQEVQRQKVEFYDAIRPAARDAVVSTVWIWANTGRGTKPVIYGTVVEDGTKVLTKWSEIAMARGAIQVVGGDGTTAKATVVGVHQEEDIAVLELEGASFHPVVFSAEESPKIGRFLVAASPDDTPASVGVVAVEARSLREQDHAFLGVGLDAKHKGGGVRVNEVRDGSAAGQAGLKADDVIRSIGGRDVNSLIEVQTVLAGHVPGDKVAIVYQRGGKDLSTEATLNAKTEVFQQVENQRLNQMERMGTIPSLVRSGFPRVIQTDMPLEPEHCGGPVVDLDGKVVGITIARGDRTRSFVIPSDSIIELLGKNPVSPQVAQAEREAERQKQQQQVGQAPPRQRTLPPGTKPKDLAKAAERMRSHLEEMQRLMERMDDEMETIEGR